MIGSDSANGIVRDQTRRDQDHQILEQINQLRQVSKVGQAIMSEMNLDDLLDLIMDQTVQILNVERCTIFLYDSRPDELWSRVATGIKNKKIRIPSSFGIAGWVFKNREPLIIRDAYNDSRFYSEIDKETGFQTRNVLCIPLINRSDICIGTLQTLNKKIGDFTQSDKELLVSISHYISIALENARLYEDLKSINTARKKVIDHLAHEIRTPVAIIDAALKHISRQLDEGNTPNLDKAITRGRRNLVRLMSLQEKITDILNYRFTEDKQKMTQLIETFFNLTEEACEASHDSNANVFQCVLQRLESIYLIEDTYPESIFLEPFFERIRNEAIKLMEERKLDITLGIQPGLILNTDPRMLKKVCSGLLRNAIEATPDEGKIDIRAKHREGHISIDFQDWGVGINPENQKNIFNGFYHTQDTDYYASRKPYAFYAGGSGSDLLRIKVFSERFGFEVSSTSQCCKYIPGDKNMCPGRISACGYIDDISDCNASGGSTFYVRFPLK